MDDATSVVRALADTVSARGLAQIQFVSVDNPSVRLVQELRCVCPNLQVVSLDPIHLAMTWEYASGRKRTQGSSALRRLLAKFTAVDATCSAARWGRAHDGGACAQLTYEEARTQRQIQDRSMRLRTAESFLANLDPSKPFYLRLDWIKALASLASVYKQEVERISPGPNRRIYELLFSAASAPRAEWYMNNVRARHMMEPRRLSLLPVGTTSNESLHHEINAWFRETQQIHQSTLQLKLQILQLCKNLSHNAALYRPTCRQMPHAELLSRVSLMPLWQPHQWMEWCSELADDTGVSKARLPLHEKRESERRKVRLTVKRRPAASVPKRRRTPHTLERVDSFRRAGVKRCVVG